MTRKPRSKFWGVLRLCLFCLVIAFAGLAIGVHQSVATVRGRMFEFGDQLSELTGQFRTSGVHQLRINKQPIQLEVLTTSTPVETVLDRVETWCVRHAGRLSEQLAEARAFQGEFVDSDLLDATLREERNGRGFVACLDMGGNKLSWQELVTRLQKYRQTRDVHDIGDFHYVRVEPADGATRIIRVWVEDSFSVENMFPATGDAPGSDVSGVARPSTGRRILSATVGDELGYRWTVYEGVNGTAAEVLATYRDNLVRAGWRLSALGEGAPAVLAQRGEEALVVVVSPGDGQGLLVSFATVSKEESL